MCDKKKHIQRGFGLIIVSLLVLGGVGQILPIQEESLATASSEESTSQTIQAPTAIEGNTWYIDDTVYMNGSEGQASFSGDYNVQINSSGELVINDATFRLTLDRFHRWEIMVKDGGELRLKNSKISTTLREGGQLRPYYNTTLDVRGSLVLHHGSSLNFPGWVYGRDASIDIVNSSFRPLNITGLNDQEDDCPRLITYDSEVNIIDSEIEGYYENDQLQVSNQDFVPLNYPSLWENDDEYYPVGGGESLTISDWTDFTSFYPTKRISALYLQARYYTEENYTGQPLRYNTGSGWKTATVLRSSSDGRVDGSIIWSLETDNLTEVNDIQVEFDNTANPTDLGGANFTQIRMIFDYENDLTFFGSDVTVINSRIDVDFNPSDIDPRYDVQRSTNSSNWLIDSSYEHTAIRLLDGSEARIYAVNASNDPQANGDPIVVQDSTSVSYLYRWAQIKALDKAGTAMSGANITVSADTEKAALNQKVNNLNAPSNNTIAWNYMRWAYEGHYDQSDDHYVTGSNGHVTFFLLSDIIDQPEDWPNADHVGTYQVSGTYHNSTHDVDQAEVQKQKSLAAFPDISWQSNHPKKELKFNTTLSYWEFTPTDLSVEPDPVTRGMDLTIVTTIRNNGDLSAVGENVKVDFYIDGSKSPVTSVSITTLTSSSGSNPVETNRTKWNVNLPAGPHNLTAKVDPDNQFLERYEDNNTIYKNFEVKGKPDLTVQQVTLTPDSNVITGREVNVSATIENTGAGLSSNVMVEFTEESTGDVIGSTSVSSIPGESTTITDSVPWDYNPEPGEYTVRAEVDPDNTTDESDETNNLGFNTLNVVLPDMWVSDVYASPIEGAVGSTFDVWANVKHSGVPASSEVDLAFINSDTDEEIGRITVDLADDPDQFETDSIGWDGYSGVGTYNITAEIDPDDNITESNEENNIFDGFTKITVYPKPDLRIGSMTFTPSGEVEHGTTVTITAVVSNTGVTRVENINVVFKRDDAETGRRLESSTIALEPQSSQTLSFDWTAEVDTGHTTDYDIYGIVDPKDTVLESNEGNNQVSKTLTVNQRPDLAISGLSVNRTDVTEGDRISIEGTISNIGQTDAHNVKVNYYAVRVNSPDILIGTHEIAGVPGKGEQSTSMTWNTNLTDPDNKVETRQIRVAISDQMNPLNDINTENNQAQAEVVVSAPPKLEMDMTLKVDEVTINETNGTTIRERDTLNVTVEVKNNGGTDIQNGLFELIYQGGKITTLKDFGLKQGKSKTLSQNWLLDITGSQTITAWVNSSEKNAKYRFSVSRNITIQGISLEITEPDIPENPKADSEVTVGGKVVRQSDGEPVSDIEVVVYLTDDKGNKKTDEVSDSTNDMGEFSVSLTTPEEDGDYTIVVQTMADEPKEWNTISVKSPDEGGLIPWWIIAIIIAAAAVAVVVVAYFQLTGEEEMVECGNCGSTIPADSTTCPECGVDFDMSTVKCSECGEWIPADAETCPNCGAEFIATGKEVEDYRERMKQQYQKYVQKFMDEAKQEMGKRDLSKDEFMRWWKQQPSYLTFEEWLEREEERRKKGSLECPECGALNSIDDAICQKCGSPLIEVEGREQSGRQSSKGRQRKEQPSQKQQTNEQSQPRQQKSGSQQQRKQQESGTVKKVKKRPKEKKVKKKVVKKPNEEE